jgi:uncharacterized protein
MSRRRLIALVSALTLLASLAALPAGASVLAGADADQPRDDAVWTEHYFPGGEGHDPVTMLHADVLRPAHLPPDEPTPVILTVSPYTNHSGDPLAYNPTRHGPSERFFDFLDLSGALAAGYTYVIVDLPGTGGSGGCNDWGGEREQGAVKAAVEWSASQPWSNGRVGLIGKSYDAWTGLMGVAQQPEGLEAVVAQAPVYSGYRYLYNNGVRFSNSVLTPALFQAIDATPGPLTSDPYYNVNGAPQAWCYGLNQGLAQSDDPDFPYWTERDLLPTTAGKETPVFLTQGFLERNTKPDAAFEFWNNLGGAHNRAWFGQFDHDRGWDLCSGGRPCTGRAQEVFIAEVMRFFDTHLKGVAAEDEEAALEPTVAVQDALGRYRAEDAWPPGDTVTHTTELNTGAYTDTGSGSGTQPAAGRGIWTVSEPLDHDVWLTGEPTLTATVTTQVPRANLVANVYDIDPDGNATLVNRGTLLLRDRGEQQVELPLYGQDWPLAAGHRIGVNVSSANSDWWVHVPTNSTVTVAEAAIALPFLTYERTEFLDGGSTPRLEQHRGTARHPGDLTAAERPFQVPGPLAERPAED